MTAADPSAGTEADPGARKTPGPDHHLALFYEDDEAARDEARKHAYRGLRRGEFVILFAPIWEGVAWTSLLHELEEEARTHAWPGRVATLFFPPSTLEATGRLLSGFLAEVRRELLRPEEDVLVFAQLGDEAALPPGEVCTLGTECQECSTACLFHVKQLAESLRSADGRRTTVITALNVAPEPVERAAPRPVPLPSPRPR